MREIARRVTLYWADTITGGKEILILEAEEYAERAIFDKKKKYAYASSGELHVKGMITERRDQPLFAREVVHMVLEKVLVYGARKHEVENIIQVYIRELCSNKVDTQRLAATCKYSKPWYEYTETGPIPVFVHARSQSRHHATNGAAQEYHLGDRIPYVITRTILHPPLQSTVLSLLDLKWVPHMRLRIRLANRTYVFSRLPPNNGNATDFILPTPVPLRPIVCVFLDHISEDIEDPEKGFGTGFKGMAPTAAALQGMRSSRIEHMKTLFGRSLTLTFLYQDSAISLRAEDVLFACTSDIDKEYYTQIIHTHTQALLEHL
jgi:hypothetical protein